MVSGGKDGRLQFTDLRNGNCQSILIALEPHPILSLCLSPDLTMVWVGTGKHKGYMQRLWYVVLMKKLNGIVFCLADSTIRAWPLPQVSPHGDDYGNSNE